MESKKGGASIDDLFGRKEVNKPSSGSSYFNSVFATSPNTVLFYFLIPSLFIVLSIRSR